MFSTSRTFSLQRVTHGEWLALGIDVCDIDGIQHVVEMGDLSVGIGDLDRRNVEQKYLTENKHLRWGIGRL